MGAPFFVGVKYSCWSDWCGWWDWCGWLYWSYLGGGVVPCSRAKKITKGLCPDLFPKI